MNQPTDGQGGDSRSRIDVYRCRNVTNLIQPTSTSSWGPAWGCTMFLRMPKKLSFDHLVLGYFSADLWVDLLLWGVIRIRSRVLQWVESSFLLKQKFGLRYKQRWIESSLLLENSHFYIYSSALSKVAKKGCCVEEKKDKLPQLWKFAARVAKCKKQFPEPVGIIWTWTSYLHE